MVQRRAGAVGLHGAVTTGDVVLITIGMSFLSSVIVGIIVLGIRRWLDRKPRRAEGVKRDIEMLGWAYHYKRETRDRERAQRARTRQGRRPSQEEVAVERRQMEAEDEEVRRAGEEWEAAKRCRGG